MDNLDRAFEAEMRWQAEQLARQQRHTSQALPVTAVRECEDCLHPIPRRGWPPCRRRHVALIVRN